MNPTSSSTRINLRIKSQDGNNLFFKARRDTQLKKVLTAYCERKGVDYKTIRFLINGDRFEDHHNADDLGLQDGDEILAMSPMDGGGHLIVQTSMLGIF